MKKTVLLSLGFVILITIISCINKKKITSNYTEDLNYNFKEVVDSIKNDIIKKDGDYIYFRRAIIPKFNYNFYIFYKNTSIGLYKINAFGAYKYESVYWSNESFRYFTNMSDKILNDSIVRGNVFRDGDPWYDLECRIEGKFFKQSSFFYMLKQEQPISLFVSILERDILNAEQDKLRWIKLK